MEQWKYNNTYSGTPQGAVLSPLFANIYLGNWIFVETKLIPENTRGNKEPETTNMKLLTLEHTTKERGS